jgi:hypothetical protein
MEAPDTYISKHFGVRTGSGSGAAPSGSITNGRVTIGVDPATGMVSGWSNTANGVNVPNFSQQWLGYDSVGRFTTPKSGAYIFRPNGTVTAVTNATAIVSIVTGPVVQEMQQSVAPFITQRVRLYANSDVAEFEYTVGPLPIKNGLGLEVVARYASGAPGNGAWGTNASWWTDANGRDMQLRIRNYRPTWNLTIEEPVAGNYYPVPTALQVGGVLYCHVVSHNAHAVCSYET